MRILSFERVLLELVRGVLGGIAFALIFLAIMILLGNSWSGIIGMFLFLSVGFGGLMFVIRLFSLYSAQQILKRLVSEGNPIEFCSFSSTSRMLGWPGALILTNDSIIYNDMLGKKEKIRLNELASIKKGWAPFTLLGSGDLEIKMKEGGEKRYFVDELNKWLSFFQNKK